MVYGSNVLTNNWVIQNGYMLGSALVLHAGGIASQNVTATEIAIVPEKLLLEIDADRYAVRYTPIDTVQFEISYNNFTSDSILVPLNQVVEITPKSDIKETFVVTIRVSQPTTISAITLKIPQSIGGIQENTDYFGVSISRNYGLRVEKSNGASEAIFNSDVFEMNAKDTQGVMRKRIYFDPVAGNYIFDGLLSATAIEAISAEIDVVISNTVIVNNLYSEYGRIANLTVSELNTGWQKITNFLANNKAPVFYKRDYEQYSMYYEAVTDGTEDPNTLTDRDGNLLYWVDNTYKGMTLANTGLPVKTYKYTEYLKMEISFRDVDGVTRPRIIMGAGYGNPSFPERGKFIIDKHVDGGLLEYITANGTRYSIEIGENGILQNGVELLSAIDFYSNGFTATYGGTIAGYRWTKDGTGKIMQLTNIHTSETVPVTWGGGPL